MTIQQVVLQYETRIIELHLALAQFRWHHALYAALLTIALLLFFALGVYAIRAQLSLVWLPVSGAMAAALALRLRQMGRSKSRAWRLSRFYERALQRVKGEWAGCGITGEEFIDPNHVYAGDLNILGEGSLFELLCIARSSLGRRGLADYLLETPALEETLARQDAVRELCERTDLREEIATLGEFDFEESHPEIFDDWLNSPEFAFFRPLPMIAATTSALLAGIVAAGLLGILPWAIVAISISPLVAFHAAAGFVFRNRVNHMADSLRPLLFETRVLRDGLRLLETEQFQAPKLRQMVDQVQNSSTSIRKLERLLHALQLRTRDPWIYGPSLALLAGTQLCIAVEQWRSKHGKALRVWLKAWSEFEALNCLAAYSYENPENTFPEFASSETCFQACDLGHPLLSRASCVTNDIELNRDSRFYVISGSNMSGKKHAAANHRTQCRARVRWGPRAGPISSNVRAFDFWVTFAGGFFAQWQIQVSRRTRPAASGDPIGDTESARIISSG